MQLNCSTKFVSVTTQEDNQEILINANNISYVLIDKNIVRLLESQGGGDAYFRITPQSCKDLVDALKS